MPRVITHPRGCSLFLVGAFSPASRCLAQDSLPLPGDAFLSQPPDGPAGNAVDLNSRLDAADKPGRGARGLSAELTGDRPPLGIGPSIGSAASGEFENSAGGHRRLNQAGTSRRFGMPGSAHRGNEPMTSEATTLVPRADGLLPQRQYAKNDVRRGAPARPADGGRSIGL